MKLVLSTLALTAWAVAASPARADVLYVLNEFLDSSLRPGPNIEKVTSSGSVIPLTGPGQFGSAAYDLAFGPNGNVFGGGGGGLEIYEMTPAGSVSPFATLPFGGDFGLAFNANGDLFVTGYADAALHGGIYKVTPSGNVSLFTTITATSGALYGLAIDASGDIFVSSDSLNGSIYEVTPSGNVNTFLSGVSEATSLAFGPDGDLYYSASVSPTSGNRDIFKATPSGAVSTVFSGFTYPNDILDIAFNSSGNLFFADGSSSVFEVTGQSSYSLFATGFEYDTTALAFQPSQQPAAVPEPSSLTLLGLGAIGFLGFVRRRASASA